MFLFIHLFVALVCLSVAIICVWFRYLDDECRTAASELILEWETWKARPEGPREAGFWGGDAKPSPPGRGSGSPVSSPAGSGAEPRPPKGFLALYAARLPLDPCVDLLHGVYLQLCVWLGVTYMACPSWPWAGVYMTHVSHRFRRLCLPVCVARHLSELRLHKSLGLFCAWSLCTLRLWHCLQFSVCLQFCYVVHDHVYWLSDEWFLSVA